MNPATDPGEGREAGWLARAEWVRAACEAWLLDAGADGISHGVPQSAPTAAARRARARALCREVLGLATPGAGQPPAASEPEPFPPDAPDLDAPAADAVLAAREAWLALADLATEVLARPSVSELHDARLRVLCRYAERCVRLQREACRVVAGAERPTAPA